MFTKSKVRSVTKEAVTPSYLGDSMGSHHHHHHQVFFYLCCAVILVGFFLGPNCFLNRKTLISSFSILINISRN